MTSLRERKRAKTRAALVAVSQRLFLDRGYRETTLEAICAKVEITVPTLLRYFGSKAALGLAPQADALEPLLVSLADSERTEPALDIWAAFIRWEVAQLLEPAAPWVASYVENLQRYESWSDRDSDLVAEGAALERRTQATLAAALAIDSGVTADRADRDLHSALLATLLVQGRVNVYRLWLARPALDRGLLDDQVAVLDYAVASLPRSGLQALAARPAASNRVGLNSG